MTKRKAAPKHKRKRGLPIQVYVSPEERADLRATARKRGVTVSTLVRNWIRRAAAAERGALRDSAAAVDPRQLLFCLRCGEQLDGPDRNWCPACAYIETSARLSSLSVLRGVEPCCDSPLLHLGIHDASCPADRMTD
jgi:hypothetical protein